MKIGVRAEAEDRRNATIKHIVSAYLSFVSLDDNQITSECLGFHTEK